MLKTISAALLAVSVLVVRARDGRTARAGPRMPRRQGRPRESGRARTPMPGWAAIIPPSPARHHHAISGITIASTGID